MPLFRRKAAPDPALAEAREAFGRLAARLDAAQRLLLAAIPTSRDEGVPLAQALASFERALGEVEPLMPAWRSDATEEIWQECAAALRESAAEAARLRLEPGRLAFEPLNQRIGDVLEPLETFIDAERALR